MAGTEVFDLQPEASEARRKQRGVIYGRVTVSRGKKMTFGFGLKPNPAWQGHKVNNMHIKLELMGKMV